MILHFVPLYVLSCLVFRQTNHIFLLTSHVMSGNDKRTSSATWLYKSSANGKHDRPKINPLNDPQLCYTLSTLPGTGMGYVRIVTYPFVSFGKPTTDISFNEVLQVKLSQALIREFLWLGLLSDRQTCLFPVSPFLLYVRTVHEDINKFRWGLNGSKWFD